jgi:hypothetical protein
MSVMMVRQTLKDGSVQEAEAAVRDLFGWTDAGGRAPRRRRLLQPVRDRREEPAVR